MTLVLISAILLKPRAACQSASQCDCSFSSYISCSKPRIKTVAIGCLNPDV